MYSSFRFLTVWKCAATWVRKERSTHSWSSGLGGVWPQGIVTLLGYRPALSFPRPIESPAEEIIRKILYPFWDVGYEVGYTVQSLDECLEMAGSELSF